MDIVISTVKLATDLLGHAEYRGIQYFGFLIKTIYLITQRDLFSNLWRLETRTWCSYFRFLKESRDESQELSY